MSKKRKLGKCYVKLVPSRFLYGAFDKGDLGTVYKVIKEKDKVYKLMELNRYSDDTYKVSKKTLKKDYINVEKIISKVEYVGKKYICSVKQQVRFRNLGDFINDSECIVLYKSDKFAAVMDFNGYFAILPLINGNYTLTEKEDQGRCNIANVWKDKNYLRRAITLLGNGIEYELYATVDCDMYDLGYNKNLEKEVSQSLKDESFNDVKTKIVLRTTDGSRLCEVDEEEQLAENIIDITNDDVRNYVKSNDYKNIDTAINFDMEYYAEKTIRNKSLKEQAIYFLHYIAKFKNGIFGTHMQYFNKYSLIKLRINGYSLFNIARSYNLGVAKYINNNLSNNVDEEVHKIFDEVIEIIKNGDEPTFKDNMLNLKKMCDLK